MLTLIEVPVIPPLCLTLLSLEFGVGTGLPAGHGKGTAKMAANAYEYIPKLALSSAHKADIEEKLVEARTKLDRLLAEYQSEKFAALTVDERITEAQNLLSSNLPAAGALVNHTLQLPGLTTKQRAQCYHLLYLINKSLGPLSESLSAAKQGYDLVKSAVLATGGDEMAPSTIGDAGGSVAATASKMSPEHVLVMRLRAALDLGYAHCFLGNLAEAEPYLAEASQLAAKTGDAEWIATTSIHHGERILASGHLKDAIGKVFLPLLKRGNMSEENRGKLLQAFGNACRAAADWGPAKDYMTESITIAERLGDPVAVADRQGDLGTIFRSEGRFADALVYQQKQLKFAMERGDQAALCTACFNIGFTSFSMQPPMYDRALVYHSVQLELAHGIGHLAMKARALSCLGKIYIAWKDYSSAITFLEAGLDVQELTGDLRGMGIAYGNIGTVYRAMGKFDEAVEYHEKYRENAADRDDVGGVAIMQRELAMDFLFKKDLDMAEKHITDAFFTLERIRAKIGSEDTSRIANFEKNQAEAFNLLQTILIAKGKYREALALSEQGRARALSDLIVRNLEERDQSSPGNDTNPSYVSTISMLEESFIESALSDIFQAARELSTTLVVYSIVTEFSPSGDAEKWLYAWVVAEETVAPGDGGAGNFAVHFAKRTLRFEKKANGGVADDKHVSDLCRSLGELNVTEGNQEETDVCKPGRQSDPPTPTKECTENSPSPTRDIPHQLYKQEQVQHQALYPDPVDKPKKKPEQAQTDPRLKEALAKLRDDYDIFIAPIESYLPKWNEGMSDVPRVTFVPHGYIFNLPFCALLGPDGRHLVEKYIISFVPSVRTLTLTNQRLAALRESSTTAPPSVLAVGNPTMPHPKIPPLPAASEEAKMVKNFFQSHSGVEERSSSVVLTGSEATVDNVRREMTGHSVLHFATHADRKTALLRMIAQGSPGGLQSEEIISGDFIMQGYLVLARSHRNCSGLLMAEEVKGHRLKAEVAVLSCCRTGTGQVTGDGVLGLYRSFLVAGAASVVVAHWKIPDKATAKFMGHFYEDFMVHRDSARALRQAMLSMLGDSEHRFLPKHWAAFVVIGASCPVPAL